MIMEFYCSVCEVTAPLDLTDYIMGDGMTFNCRACGTEFTIQLNVKEGRKMVTRKTNRQLLIDRLYRNLSAYDGTNSTVVLQGQAEFLAKELLALASGAKECKGHSDKVEGACPVCLGFYDKV